MMFIISGGACAAASVSILPNYSIVDENSSEIVVWRLLFNSYKVEENPGIPSELVPII